MVKDAIANYLDNNGIKQNYVAKKANMSEQAICTFLNGTRKLDIEEYISICNVLKVPYNYFIEISESQVNKSA